MQSARKHVAVLAMARAPVSANDSTAIAIDGIAGYAPAVLPLMVRRRRVAAAKGLQN
jgi:hypothetical protein